MRKARYPSISCWGNGMARRCEESTRVHTIMPRLPLAIRGGRAAVDRENAAPVRHECAGLWRRRRGHRSDRRRPRPSAVYGSARRGIACGAVIRRVDRVTRRNREYRRLTLPKQWSYGILCSAAAVARSFGQADRNVDRDDRRGLWSGEHIGKVRIDGDDAVVTCRPDENRNPAARTSIDARQPEICCSLTHMPTVARALL